MTCAHACVLAMLASAHGGGMHVTAQQVLLHDMQHVHTACMCVCSACDADGGGKRAPTPRPGPSMDSLLHSPSTALPTTTTFTVRCHARAPLDVVDKARPRAQAPVTPKDLLATCCG